MQSCLCYCPPTCFRHFLSRPHSLPWIPRPTIVAPAIHLVRDVRAQNASCSMCLPSVRTRSVPTHWRPISRPTPPPSSADATTATGASSYLHQEAMGIFVLTSWFLTLVLVCISLHPYWHVHLDTISNSITPILMHSYSRPHIDTDKWSHTLVPTHTPRARQVAAHGGLYSALRVPPHAHPEPGAAYMGGVGICREWVGGGEDAGVCGCACVCVCVCVYASVLMLIFFYLIPFIYVYIFIVVNIQAITDNWYKHHIHAHASVSVQRGCGVPSPHSGQRHARGLTEAKTNRWDNTTHVNMHTHACKCIRTHVSGYFRFMVADPNSGPYTVKMTQRWRWWWCWKWLITDASARSTLTYLPSTNPPTHPPTNRGLCPGNMLRPQHHHRQIEVRVHEKRKWRHHLTLRGGHGALQIGVEDAARGMGVVGVCMCVCVCW